MHPSLHSNINTAVDEVLYPPGKLQQGGVAVEEHKGCLSVTWSLHTLLAPSFIKHLLPFTVYFPSTTHSIYLLTDIPWFLFSPMIFPFAALILFYLSFSSLFPHSQLFSLYTFMSVYISIHFHSISILCSLLLTIIPVSYLPRLLFVSPFPLPVHHFPSTPIYLQFLFLSIHLLYICPGSNFIPPISLVPFSFLQFSLFSTRRPLLQ